MVYRAPWSYLVATAAIVLMTVFIKLIHADVTLANVPMLYLIAVTLISFFCGSLPAIYSGILAFVGFDWFFVKPHFQLTVTDPAEWLALIVFLLTATLTGQLTALLRERAEEARLSKEEFQALADASWTVVSELDRDRAIDFVMTQLVRVVGPEFAAVFVKEPGSSFKKISQYVAPELVEASVVQKLAHKASVLASKKFDIPDADAMKVQNSNEINDDIDASSVFLPIVLDKQELGGVFLRLREGSREDSRDKPVLQSLLNHMAVILQRERLMKAQALAQALAEADKLKTAILSMVSHDFRSPLTAIKASAGSLLEDEKPLDRETQQALLQGVIDESDRLNRMVGNVLDLSRLEAGAWRTRREMIPVLELVGSALDSLSEEENERITVDIGPNVNEFAGDSVQLVQVVHNLLENALKYSPANSVVELQISVESNMILIDVSDRGPGLPEGEEQQIFQPFYRAKGHNESSIPGVGIGLALCRGLVEANGGTLAADNREGGGARFRISFVL